MEGDGLMSRRGGYIVAIVGGMFSGKTEEEIRLLNRAKIAGKRTLLVKHSSDDRYSVADVVSHIDRRFQCVLASSVEGILERVNEHEDVEVVGIDEAQFYGPDLVELCNQLADQGMTVIVAGLDMDFRGLPFGPMPSLMAVAEEVKKLRAICTRCGDEAAFSWRTEASQELVVVGGSEQYEALCRPCFVGARETASAARGTAA
jgi:thymidine kinase